MSYRPLVCPDHQTVVTIHTELDHYCEWCGKKMVPEERRRKGRRSTDRCPDETPDIKVTRLRPEQIEDDDGNMPETPAPDGKKPSPIDEWTCVSCGWKSNPPGRNVCDNCGDPRPSPSEAARRWRCLRCGAVWSTFPEGPHHTWLSSNQPICDGTLILDPSAGGTP